MIIRLISQLFKLTGRVDEQTRTTVGAHGIKALDRRSPIGDVIATHVVLRQVGAGEVDHDLIALLTHVDGRVRVGQLDDDAAGTIGTAPEIETADTAAVGGGGCRRPARLSRRNGGGSDHRRRLTQRDKQTVALSARGIRDQAIEIEHHTGTACALCGHDGIEAGLVHIDAPRSQRQGRARQVQGNARRIVDGERQRLRCGTGEFELQLQALPGQRLHIDGFEPVTGCLCGVGRTQCRHDAYEQRQQQRAQRCSDGDESVHSSCLPAGHSFTARAAGRSMKPPNPSGTISMTLILVALISLTRPSFWPM